MGLGLEMVLKVAGVGLVVAIMAIMLEQAGKKEQATLVTLAGVVAVLYIVIDGIAQVFTLVKSVFQLY
ncbi:MAG: stage III sporulation protein AC [Peptococcaceae bacterium]|jgi:stage III sporulation protein AC|nr:stage III sporulation protein AC [Peptococcaceae bacterium]